MAEAISVQNTSGQLVCSICKNMFPEMTLSSCFHTFCLDCLRGHFKYSARSGRNYECPICKTKINLPAGLLKDEEFPAHVVSGSKTGNYTSSDFIKLDFCDICDEKKPAINKCLQCQENLCYSCTNAHLKMKASRYHGQRVVPVGNQGYSVSDGKDDPLPADLMLCPRHVNQEIIFICKKCDVILCNVCKLLEHENHVTRLVSDEASEVREKITSLLERQTGFSESLQLHEQILSQNGQQFPHALQRELLKLQTHASLIHAEVEKGRTELERDLVNHYSAHIQKNDENCANARQNYQEYVRLSQEAQSILDNASDVHVVKNGRRLYDQLHDIEKGNGDRRDYKEPSRRFAVGSIQSENLHKMVGFIHGHGQTGPVTTTLATHEHITGSSYQAPKQRGSLSSDVRSYQSRRGSQPRHAVQQATTSVQSASHESLNQSKDMQLTLSSLSKMTVPFRDGIGYVYGIAPVKDGSSAWVSLLGNSHVTLIHKGGSIITSVDVGHIVEDVAHDGDGGCFVTCPAERSIKHVTNKGEVVSIATDLSKIPHGIAARRCSDSANKQSVEEELCVCFTDNNDASMVSSLRGCMKVLSFGGKDLDKSVSLQAPTRVDVSARSGSICISDYTHGCVMVTDKTGDVVKCIYTSEDNENPFRPLGVCFDHTDCILTTDWSAGDVKRITEDGSLVQVLSTGVEGSQSLALDNEGILWVGGRLGAVNTFKLY